MKYICKICQKVFYDQPRKKRKYCSVECSVQSSKSGMQQHIKMYDAVDELLKYTNKDKNKFN